MSWFTNRAAISARLWRYLAPLHWFLGLALRSILWLHKTGRFLYGGLVAQGFLDSGARRGPSTETGLAYSFNIRLGTKAMPVKSACIS